MKTLLATILMFMLVATTASATVIINQVGNLQLGIMKQAGVSSYSDSSQGWNLTDYGKFYIHSNNVVGQGVLEPASFSFPTSIVLNRQSGSETLTINLACREGSGFSPNKNDGYACANTFSDIGINLASSLYTSISLIPTSATFSGSNVSGSYTGSLTISVNYL